MSRVDATGGRSRSLVARSCLCASMPLILIGLLAATSFAATRSWDGGGGTDTDWTTDANWSSNIEPGPSDTAEFDRGFVVYTVTFPLLPFGVDETTDRLIVGSNTVTFEPGGRSNTNYLVTAPATDETGRGIIIGEEADDFTATLISHLGLLSTAAATLGHVAGSSGTLRLRGMALAMFLLLFVICCRTSAAGFEAASVAGIVLFFWRGGDDRRHADRIVRSQRC